MLTLTEIIKTRISTVQLMENGLLHINIEPNSVILAEDVHELLEVVYKIGGGKKFKKLITLGEYTLADLETMKLSANEEGSKYKIAEAYVVKGMAQCMLISFYMYIIKPSNPAKFFTNETDAQNWLLSIE